MQPILYKKIQKLIKTKQLTSLTIDIFDTILFNDYWPAELRIYDLARKWAADIYRLTTLNLRAYELFDLYQFAQEELNRTNHPPRIDLALDIMLDMICLKHKATLNSEERLSLLAAMIATSLQFKITNVRPNHNLIAQITNLKQANPDLKVYFLADSCFCATQIKTMLEILGIKIFDNGIASSDLNADKSSGAIYEQLAAEFTNFDLARNLHLGDHRVPDYLMPILHDSIAIHYRPVRMRGLRTLVGKSALRVIRFQANHQERKNFTANNPEVTLGDGWRKYGTIKGEWQKLWGWQVTVRAQLVAEQNYLLANNLSELEINFSETSNIMSSALNQTLVVRAFVWLLATFETTRWNAPKLLQLVAKAANITKREQLYQICFGDDAVFSQLALESHTTDEFFQELLNEVKNGDAELSKNLRSSYEQLVQYLPRDEKNCCVVVKNSDQTTMLFREFARLHGVGNEISEWILDADGALNQAQSQVETQINTRRAKYVQRGEKNAATLLAQTQLNSHTYTQQILKPRLKQIVKSLQ